MKTTTPGDGGRFRLLRYFAIASLVGVVLAGAGFGLFFRGTALKQIVRMGEDNNVALARALAGSLRPYYAPLIAGKSPDAPRLSRELEQIVRETVRDTRVVKVSLYDPAGRTVYTSNADVGPDEAAAPGFIDALAGNVSTQLDRPSAFDITGLALAEPSVLTTHVPVRASGSDKVDAVFALSSDATPFFEQIRHTQIALRYASAAVLISLFGILFLVARRADKVIKTQDDQRQRDADTIRHLAQHDELTGLPGRKLFADRLALALARARRNKTAAAVMFIDLDNFKEVNDTFGHTVGDRVLVGAGRLLRAALRTSDTVARLGGDEFTIIVENVADAQSVETVAEKIRSAFMPPVVVADGEAVFVTPSIGIALYPRDAVEPEALMNAADAAMYDAKAAGRDAYSFYGEKPKARVEEPVTSA
ncbi:MAG TPA: GGDEF domain-containing protein [Burkholderiales bacterium]|nr:GGDEF domain-containing protein [Burkholderiales bacterium]